MYREGRDFFPEGCPCGLTQEQAIANLNKLKAKYVVFVLDTNVKKAVKLFEEGGLIMESQTIKDPSEIVASAVRTLTAFLEQFV